MTISIHEITAALHARRTSAGWIARCPAHGDHTPSLSISQRDGRVLVHCHAGCAQADIIAALRERGLWPEYRERRLRPASDPDRARDMARADSWRKSAILLAEWLLETISLTDPARMPLTALLRVVHLGDDALLSEYRAWRMRDPELTAGLVHAGRLSNARLQRRLAQWIEGDMQGDFDEQTSP
jgi:hypothetical protein